MTLRLRLRKQTGFVAPLATVALAMFVIAVLGGTLYAVTHAQSISDYFRLRNYQASPAIVELANDSAMNDYGRKLFYVNHPEIDDREAFNAACTNRSEQTIVLGCYHSKDRGIFIFSVQDVRLEGVEEVTAAHEMLHVAYDRLSAKEKSRINALLQNYYSTITDQRIIDTINAYKKTEPNDVQNEMHSIFATEMTILPAELEEYYKRYFINRVPVVRLANNYQGEFTRRQVQVKTFDKQLEELKKQIDSDTREIKQGEAVIVSQREQLERLRTRGDIDAYNAGVPQYNQRIESYNALIVTAQNRIVQYNTIVKQRNSLASEVKELTQSINSQPMPIGR